MPRKNTHYILYSRAANSPRCWNSSSSVFIKRLIASALEKPSWSVAIDPRELLWRTISVDGPTAMYHTAPFYRVAVGRVIIAVYCARK